MKYDIRDNFEEIASIPCELFVGSLERVPNPVLSVVVPTYRRPTLLRETIESIINQKDVFVPYEIIIMDNDDSVGANETETMLKEWNISNLLYYKNQKNVGAVGNWNRCIMMARSNWIIMCHDDDLLKDDCLSTMYRIIELHKNDPLPLGYVRSSSESFYEEGVNPVIRKTRKRPFKKKTALIQFSNSDVILSGGATWAGAPTCGTLINKEAAMAVGGYNREHSPCPDCYVPYHMLPNYGVYKTYYSFGRYRWGQNDTYRKSTLLGLIEAYNDFLIIQSRQYPLVRFFENEHYYDCVKYYSAKGHEAGVEISDEEILKIRSPQHSKLKLRLLYMMRKINHYLKVLAAR